MYDKVKFAAALRKVALLIESGDLTPGQGSLTKTQMSPWIPPADIDSTITYYPNCSLGHVAAHYEDRHEYLGVNDASQAERLVWPEQILTTYEWHRITKANDLGRWDEVVYELREAAHRLVAAL